MPTAPDHTPWRPGFLLGGAHEANVPDWPLMAIIAVLKRAKEGDIDMAMEKYACLLACFNTVSIVDKYLLGQAPYPENTQ